MSGEITYTISGPALADAMRLLEKTRSPLAAMKVLGRATTNLYRAHFRDLHAKHPNKLGGKRTRFWLDVAKSVSLVEATEKQVKIGIGHPAIAQKVYGGTIKARRVKNLAIPLTAKAYGIGPREFKDPLHFIRSGSKKYLSDKQGVPQYLLTPSVTQKPQQDALPSQAAVVSVVYDTLQEHFSQNG